MKEPNQKPEQQREQLLREIEQLARRALFGSISETYRTCGTPGCGCHRNGPKHGPHLYVSYRGDQGKTTGYYVPKAIQAEVRASIEAWGQLQDRLRRLARLNKERLTATTRRKSTLLQQALARSRAPKKNNPKRQRRASISEFAERRMLVPHPANKPSIGVSKRSSGWCCKTCGRVQ